MKKIFNHLLKMIKWLVGYCPIHGWFCRVKKYRRNTAYVDDKKNYSYGCRLCEEEDWIYMQEMWDDYYSSRL